MRVILCYLILSVLCFAQISQEIYKGLQHDEELMKNNKIHESIKHLKQVLSKTKTDEEKSYIFKLLSNRYLTTKDYKNASKYLNEALHVNKDKDEIILNLSSLYINEKRYTDCIKILRQAKKIIPDLQKNLSICYYYNKEYKSALIYGEKYLRAKKSDSEMINLLYNASLNQKDYKSASKYFKRLFQNKDEKYYLQLAYMYEQASLGDEALALLDFAYNKGVLKQEKSISYYLYLLNDNHLYMKSVSILKRNFPEKKDYIINLLIQAKDYKSAIKTLHSLNNLSEKNTILLGKLYFKLQDYTKSIQVLKHAKLTSNSSYEGEAFILVALSYYQLKDFKKYEDTLHTALANKYVKNRAKNMLHYFD